MQTCSCGAGNGDEARFCQACGRSLAVLPPTCPACGAVNADDARFCASCGAVLNTTAAKADAAKAAGAAAAAKPADWNIGMVGQPIVSVSAAKTMAQTGAVAAAVIGAFAAIVGLVLLRDEPMLLLIQFGQVALYGLCAYGMWRGWTLAAFGAITLYAVNVISGLSILAERAGGAAPVTNWAAGFIIFILLPAGLISGFRGCLAWNRYKREGEPPAAVV